MSFPELEVIGGKGSSLLDFVLKYHPDLVSSGTHVTGTVVGGAQSQIGVNPDARVTMNEALSGNGADFIAAMQQMIDGAASVSPTGADIVNNSWGVPASQSGSFSDMLKSLDTLG
ncbi:MAG: hypothetical protein JWO69_1485 [Thermoleophilia bacterium]|nr:hypothetical protein [Thermoleophilia bacterium]